MQTPPEQSLNDINQIKRQAKELLRGFRAGDRDAIETVATHFDDADPSNFRLAQAQLVMARSLGYASWAQLKQATVGPIASRRPRTKPAEMTGSYVYDVVTVDGDQAWEFFQACRDGDVETVRTLIAADPNLVHAQYWYTQPTHFAVYANQPVVLGLLLDAGAEPGRSAAWPTLLQHAQRMGFNEVHDVLVAFARERFRFDQRFSTLQEAIVSRDIDKVRELLRTQRELATTCDGFGSNAIHWAVMTRQPDLFPMFRTAGVSPDQSRSDGQTPLQLAFNGDYKFRVWRDLKGVEHADLRTTVNALIEAGATVDLSVACAVGDADRVKRLLANNPALATRLDSGRRNPLMYAARAGHIDIVRVLLENGADPSQPEDWAPRGWSLWMACSLGHVEMVRLLLQYGADPNSAPDSSDSCLGTTRARAGAAAQEIEHMLRSKGAETATWALSNEELRAAIVNNEDVTRKEWFAEEVLARNGVALTDLLLSHDPNVVHRLHGGTLRLGSPDVAITESAVLKRLLESGFDPDRPGWLGKTALHHYAGRGETGNALLLIEHGADIDAVDDEFHSTPLGWAAANGHVATVNMLLEHGADPTIPVDHLPARPLARAQAGGHQFVISLLQSEGRT